MMTEERDAGLRRVFAHAGAATDVPESVRARLTGHDYRPRQVHRGWASGAGTLVVVTAFAVAIPLASAPAGLAARTTLRLDSYRFVMPPGYHPTHGPICTVAFSIPAPVPVPVGPPPELTGFAHHLITDPALAVNQASVVGVEGTIALGQSHGKLEAAASAHGGCILVMLQLPYRPTRRVPDPYAANEFPAVPVRVGDHRGILVRWSSEGRDGRVVRLRNGPMELFVQLPTKHHLVRDLIVGSDKLTERQLIAIVRRGLASTI